ncbi:MAG: MerR family transcriptional regulator [Clostridia bacterium]|nr:MerR family transcriptional regulator [Clostridia bacterium]
MYKIGDFSKMSKVTIKALRYYEREKLIIPAYIDEDSGYRYYETSQLIDISNILSLKQKGLSISDIKRIVNDNVDIKEVLINKKEELSKIINLYNYQLSQINYILEEKNMKNEIFVKEIPAYNVYYKEGVIETYAKLSEFVLGAGEECIKLNPNLKCVEPGYCYINYLDKGYREKDIKLRYVEAIQEIGRGNDTIKFMRTKSIKAVCIYHKGDYSKLGESYNEILKYVEDNNYKICDEIRESYIDGCWNKEKVEEYLTEIQVPIESK